MIKNNLLNFQTENLVIDYISFNIPGSDNTESIAKYLFETFNFLPRNQNEVSFRQLEYDPSSKSFWEGTIIHFSGKNAAKFYKIIQAQKFDWNILKFKKRSLVEEYMLNQKEERPSGVWSQMAWF